MEELKIKKRRADPDTTTDPIQETTNWLEDLLTKKDSDGKRVMSQPTQSRIEQLLKIYKEAASTPKEDNTISLCNKKPLLPSRRRLTVDSRPTPNMPTRESSSNHLKRTRGT